MLKTTQAELADHYNETKDLSEFELENPEPITVRRNVTISVRFSNREIAELAGGLLSAPALLGLAAATGPVSPLLAMTVFTALVVDTAVVAECALLGLRMPRDSRS